MGYIVFWNSLKEQGRKIIVEMGIINIPMDIVDGIEKGITNDPIYRRDISNIQYDNDMLSSVWPISKTSIFGEIESYLSEEFVYYIHIQK
jgi:hypothetical protein